MQRPTFSIEQANYRPIGRWYGVALNLLIASGCLLFSATTAQASCGDYLSHRGHVTMELPTRPMPLHGNDSQLPCHGPHCQQRPIQQPLPVPVITLDSQDRWSWMAKIDALPPAQVGWATHATESFVPLMIAYRLDRPPRV